MDTGEFNGVPGVNVERAAFLKSNMPENFRGRVDLAKARFFDVVLEDGTILASEGTIPPAPTLFDDINQVYFMCPAYGNPMIVFNCNDGVVVNRVEFVQPNDVSFTINGTPTKSAALKGYSQSLSFKPNAKPQDIYNNQCTIRVTISKNGKSESKEINLWDADFGRFSGQAMFFAFFEWGAPPIKLNYRDFFHEHPYGRQPILFKVYEENSRTPVEEIIAKSFYIRNGNPVPFFPIRKQLPSGYWGMPTIVAADGSSSKIPNIAVINDKNVIEKLSDYSEIGTNYRTNYTTLLILDKTKNRFEFKLYQYEKTIAKDIEYFIAKNYARPNMPQPTTRLSRMAVLFVDGETGIPTVIGSIKSDEMDNAQKAVVSYSHTEELDQYGQQMTDVQHMTYSNTFSMNADITMSRNFRKIIAAGRRGKIAIAFYEPLNNGASERSYWDYKYVYWCRLRDDIVQHTQDSRFLITTGVDDIYTIPKMTDLQITGPGSFTNKLISGGIIYDAESMPSKYRFDHPRYESSSDQPLVASGRLLYDIHRNGDTTFNTSSKPSIPHMFSRGAGFNYNDTTELLVVGINGFGLWEHSVEAIGVIGAGALPSATSPTPSPTPPNPKPATPSPGVRYIQINDDGNGFSKLAFGNTWSDRPSSHPRTHQFNYINNQGWVSTTSADRNDLTRLNHMAGSGIYPKEIESSEGTYATFIFIYENNGQSGQDNDLRLYKDDFVPGLYMKKFSPEYTTTKHLGYVGSVNNANMVPLAGIIKQSDKIGFDSDYTIRRNTLVNQAGVDDTTPDVIGKYPSRIIYVNNTRGNLDSGIRYAGDVLLSSSVIRNQNDNTKMTVSPFFNGMLPDVNQDFTEICGTANLSRDLSEWRVEATVFNALARLNMSEYPIMEITGPNLQPVSMDILRIRGPENKKPIVLNQVQNNILTAAPRVLVIENDICFDAAEGVDLDKVKLIPDNSSRPTIVIMRGRLILRHRRFADISGVSIASNFILINETQWDLDQLLRIVVLRGKDSLDPGFDIRRVRRIELTVNDNQSLGTRMYLPKGYIQPANSRHINLIPPKSYTGGVTDNGGFYTAVTRTENGSPSEYIYEGGTGQLFGPREINLDLLKSFIAKDAQRGYEAPFRFIETIGGGRKIYVFLPDNTSNITPAPGNTGSTPTPATGEATIDIVSEYIHERTGSTSLSGNIVGSRKFISISKKDNLYNPYDNMINESGNSFDLAVVEIAVKLPGDSNKYPIAVDKKTRHYVGDTVRYYLSGDLPEPIRRNPWADPLQVEIVTTIYRGAGNGNRYEIIRSARGRLVNWHHPQ